jgi:hypothetical protein
MEAVMISSARTIADLSMLRAELTDSIERLRDTIRISQTLCMELIPAQSLMELRSERPLELEHRLALKDLP